MVRHTSLADNSYGLFIATTFDESETDGALFPFYESLAARLKPVVGKDVMLAHQYLRDSDNWNLDTMKLIEESDLMLADFSVPSVTVGSSIVIAGNSCLPVIPFFQEGTYVPGSDLMAEGSVGQYWDQRIVYPDLESGLDIIVSGIRKLL